MSERTGGLWLTKRRWTIEIKRTIPSLSPAIIHLNTPNNICFANHRICLHECQLHQWWCFALFGYAKIMKKEKQNVEREEYSCDETTTAAAADDDAAAAATNEKLDTTWIWTESKRIYAMCRHTWMCGCGRACGHILMLCHYHFILLRIVFKVWRKSGKAHSVHSCWCCSRSHATVCAVLLGGTILRWIFRWNFCCFFLYSFYCRLQNPYPIDIKESHLWYLYILTLAQIM